MNSTKMIEKFISNYGSIFSGDVVQASMKNDLLKIVEKAKEEARAELYNHSTDKNDDAKLIEEDMQYWRDAQKYR